MTPTFREPYRKKMQETCPVRVFFGFDEIDELKRMRQAKEPYVYMDHAYFMRGYGPDCNFRVIYNGLHRTNVLDVPSDRNKRFSAVFHDWKEGRNHIVLIPAAKNIEAIFGKWNDKACETLATVTTREVRVKSKSDGSLKDFLHRSWGLVSHSSVAAVEAACLGFPVWGGAESPAFAVSNPDISDIENPLRPDRQQWVNTLCYSQFSIGEIEKGTAWKIISETERL